MGFWLDVSSYEVTERAPCLVSIQVSSVVCVEETTWINFWLRFFWTCFTSLVFSYWNTLNKTLFVKHINIRIASFVFFMPCWKKRSYIPLTVTLSIILSYFFRYAHYFLFTWQMNEMRSFMPCTPHCSLPLPPPVIGRGTSPTSGSVRKTGSVPLDRVKTVQQLWNRNTKFRFLWSVKIWSLCSSSLHSSGQCH